jgi:hypothetical protein
LNLIFGIAALSSMVCIPDKYARAVPKANCHSVTDQSRSKALRE